MPRRLPSLLLALLLGSAGLLTGCDTDGPESLLGKFEGSVVVEGVARDSLRGEAVYTLVDTPDGPEFVLGLFIGDLLESDYDRYDFIVFRRLGDRPGVGGYTIDDDPDSGAVVTATYANVDDADDPRTARGTILRGTTGLLAITRVDPYGFISGSFRFEGEGLPVGSPTLLFEGAADGRFEARYESPGFLRSLGADLDL